MWKLISEFFLLSHYALIFSLSVLCTVFYIRTRDRIVSRLMLILYALFIHSITSLYYHLFADKLGEFIGPISSDISLFLLVLECMAVTFVLWGTSNYLLGLLDPPENREKIARRIMMILSLIFFLFGIYFIVILHGDDWMIALSKAINDLFMYGSMILLLVAIAASIYLRQVQDSKRKQFLRSLIIAFYPICVFGAIDAIFLKDSPYNLVNISYLIFSILVYLDTTRHYVRNYEGESIEDPVSHDAFFQAMGISERERELIPHLLEGKSNKEISAILFISQNTVKTHIRNIYKKTEASNRMQLLSKIRNHPNG